MAVYRVWAESISYVFVDIEAESEEKAREIADVLDGGDFHEDGFGDWVFGDVQKMDDDVEPDFHQADFDEEE